jgi:hypothetical protein
MQIYVSYLIQFFSFSATDTRQIVFRLAPTYSLYLMARYRASTHFRAGSESLHYVSQQDGPGPAATTTSTTSAPDTTTAAATTGVPGATGRLGSSAVVASDEFQQQSQSGQHQRPPATTAGDGPRPSSPQLRNANSWSVPALHHNSEPNVGMNQSQDGNHHFQTEQQQQQFYAQQQQQQQQPAILIIQPFELSFNQGAMHAPVDMIQNQHHQQAPEPVQLAQALLPIPNEHLIIHDVTAASVKRNNGVDESMDEEEFSPRLERQKNQSSKNPSRNTHANSRNYPLVYVRPIQVKNIPSAAKKTRNECK